MMTAKSSRLLGRPRGWICLNGWHRTKGLEGHQDEIVNGWAPPCFSFYLISLAHSPFVDIFTISTRTCWQDSPYILSYFFLSSSINSRTWQSLNEDLQCVQDLECKETSRQHATKRTRCRLAFIAGNTIFTFARAAFSRYETGSRTWICKSIWTRINNIPLDMNFPFTPQWAVNVPPPYINPLTISSLYISAVVKSD